MSDSYEFHLWIRTTRQNFKSEWNDSNIQRLSKGESHSNVSSLRRSPIILPIACHPTTAQYYQPVHLFHRHTASNLR